MKRSVKRWISLLLLAAFGFAHVSLALADCPIERASLAKAMAQAAEDPCCASVSVAGYDSLYGNRCVVHCTSDLRLSASTVALVRAPSDAPVLLLARPDEGSAARARFDSPPLEAVPPRILLHSFLI